MFLYIENTANAYTHSHSSIEVSESVKSGQKTRNDTDNPPFILYSYTLDGFLVLHYLITPPMQHLIWKIYINIFIYKLIIFSCDQAALWLVFSVRLSHLFDYVPIIVSSWNFQKLSLGTRVRSMQKVKVRGQRSRSQRSRPNLTVSGLELQFEFTYDDEMIHKAWCCLEEVLYCFWKTSVKFQGHTALKIDKFDPDWAFPDCNYNLNSPMGTKWYTKLEVA